MTDIIHYKLEAAFTSLQQFDCTAKLDDFLEVNLWYNDGGFDVHLNSNGEQRFSMTWGQYKALKKLIKELDK